MRYESADAIGRRKLHAHVLPGGRFRRGTFRRQSRSRSRSLTDGEAPIDRPTSAPFQPALPIRVPCYRISALLIACRLWRGVAFVISKPACRGQAGMEQELRATVERAIVEAVRVHEPPRRSSIIDASLTPGACGSWRSPWRVIFLPSPSFRPRSHRSGPTQELHVEAAAGEQHVVERFLDVSCGH
ncbi:hypothetical protein ACVWWI_001515 [Bradyrhizobium sp. USDA 3686]